MNICPATHRVKDKNTVQNPVNIRSSVSGIRNLITPVLKREVTQDRLY